MRIRRSRSRILGSAYFVPVAPPPELPVPSQILEPCSTSLGSHDFGAFSSPVAAPKGPCQLSRSPWDLLDDLSLFDPQEVDDFLESYHVNMSYYGCQLFSANMPVTSMKDKKMISMGEGSSDKAQLPALKKDKTFKKVVVKKEENIEREAKKNANVKNEEGEEWVAKAWRCKRNDGRKWRCRNSTSHPNSFCEYHSMKKRSLTFAL